MKKEPTQRPKKAKSQSPLSPMPTLDEVDRLLEYLPKLESLNEPAIERWLTHLPDGQLMLPHPVYTPVVEDFFRLGSSHCWMDYDYIPNQAGEMLNEPERIQIATMQEWKTMFTFCVRGERFCDGHWAAMVEQGMIYALLKRLGELRVGLVEA